MMEKGNMKTKDSRFLPPMLGGSTREYTSSLTNQCTLCPKFPCGIEELSHLPTHISKSCRCAKNNRIRRSKFINFTYRDMSKGFLRFQRSHFHEYFLW